MAAPLGTINGSEIRVYRASGASNPTKEIIAYGSSCTLNIGQDVRDISSKSSAGWSEILEGQRNFSVDVEGMYAWTNQDAGTALNFPFDTAFSTYISTRTEIEFRFGTLDTDTSDTVYTGTGYITSASVTAGTEDNSTYSVTIQGTGALTVAVAS